MAEKITVEQLAQKIIESGENGFRFAELYIQKELDLLKKDRETKEPCPYGKVVSCYQANVGLNWSYENAMKKEHGEDWQAKPRRWGVRRGDTAIVDHKGKVYATVKKNRNTNGSVFADGKHIDMYDLRNFLPKKKADRRDYREIDLSTVKVASIDGERYEVTS